MVLSTVEFSKKLQPELMGVVPAMFFYGKSIIIILIGPLIACLPDITIKQILWNLYPTPSQYLQKHINHPDVKRILKNMPETKSSAGLRNYNIRKTRTLKYEMEKNIYNSLKYEGVDYEKSTYPLKENSGLINDLNKYDEHPNAIIATSNNKRRTKSLVLGSKRLSEFKGAVTKNE